MGTMSFGVPSEITLALAQLNTSRTFVETGTFRGGTTRWAATHFDKVFTIERAPAIYERNAADLGRFPNITALLGDSRRVLPEIVSALGHQRAVFWLDGHWSGADTAGESDECPLLGELAALSGRHEDIILIDDARLFLSAPPRPHNPMEWPGIGAIVEALGRHCGEPFVQIIDDVIFAVPSKERMRACLVEYAQARAASSMHDATVRRSKHIGKVRRFLSWLTG
jgi:hypothetical protein